MEVPDLYLQLEPIVEAFNTFTDRIREALIGPVRYFTAMAQELFLATYKHINPRVYYLATHSKKARVRKKNLNRLLREVLRR